MVGLEREREREKREKVSNSNFCACARVDEGPPRICGGVLLPKIRHRARERAGRATCVLARRKVGGRRAGTCAMGSGRGCARVAHFPLGRREKVAGRSRASEEMLAGEKEALPHGKLFTPSNLEICPPGKRTVLLARVP